MVGDITILSIGTGQITNISAVYEIVVDGAVSFAGVALCSKRTVAS